MYGADLDSWRRVRDSVDPEGLFVGDWLRRTVLPALKEEGGQAERLPLEEEKVDVKRNRRQGGLLWFGQQSNKSADRGSGKGSDSDEKMPPSASSEESFDEMHEAEASTVLKEIAARVRETSHHGITGVKMFEKM